MNTRYNRFEQLTIKNESVIQILTRVLDFFLFVVLVCEMCCVVNLCDVHVVQSMHSTTETRCNNGISTNQEAVPPEQHCIF